MPPRTQAARRPILFVLAAAFCFTLASALVKLVAPEVPTVEIMLFRSLVGLLVMLPLVAREGGWSVLRVHRPWGHLVRSFAGLGGMFGAYYGYATLPLAAATALGFAMPLVLAVLGVRLLGEPMRAGRLTALLAGGLGVLLVVRPWNGVTGLPLRPAAIVLAGVVAWAFAMVAIRRLGRAGERNVAIVLYYSLVCSLASAALTVPVWVTPRPMLWAVLVGIGLISALAQLLMTEGYRTGDAGMLAPFEYSALLYTVVLGWVVWGEVLGPWEAAGMILLVAAGAWSWWREGRGG